mmetsp:Transcript_30717/g.27916  ORF Transcript_30717/g.27916 Transcript_30717/m.27916 type:complete len:107 (+) Transcript_30717:332-652(+)
MIREKISDIQDLLTELGRKVKKMKKKKKTKQEAEEKENILFDLIEQVKAADKRSKGMGVEVEMTSKMKTLTEMKMDLMKDRPERAENNREMNEEEKDALEQFKKND